ncbi:GNAT family N-acetyltransferase [Candidatus Odyssella acanthamoebae]|uniref:GNAT family acetyltransferase n=1 Tax=Candidatus Odyssella acanthamoebae TaxID=91604 RepID=A0A077AV93_9PROT|nr:GNAT family N-acetyltransferase [Candidatus Paracaedibacter acanthamoebae]AIK97082.1 GNAT family acetyltransferase [Candidatus Paracaedibacter acanthamoebae]
MKIDYTPVPDSTEIDFLTQKLNKETPEFGAAETFAFFIRHETNQIIAGCNGSIFYGAIYTDQLWVHPQHRQGGLGRQLLDQVHQLGCKKGCSFAYLVTMNFQDAMGFYEKLGYFIEFERTGHTNNSVCFLLRREL